MPASLIAGLGHALLDITLQTSEAEIAEAGLELGTMALAENDAIASLLDGRAPQTTTSGGAVANTLAAISQLGGKTKLVGAVGADEAGEIFARELKKQNVASALHQSSALASGRCLVLVSEKAERTMLTCLGASIDFPDAKTIAPVFADAGFGYLELYLWDSPAGRKAALAAAESLRAQGGELVLNLSDPLCVDRHRGEIEAFLVEFQPLLVANEHEICALCQTQDFAEAVGAGKSLVPRLALTRSESGSLVIEDGTLTPLAPQKVEQVVDSTGAGDAYAGGLLFGLAAGWDLPRAGSLASLAGAKAVQQFGARPALTPALAEQVLR